MLLRYVNFKLLNRDYRRFLSNSTLADYSEKKTHPEITPPRAARVVICGGGVMGASVAYYLGKLGWANETVLIEQNKLVLFYFKEHKIHLFF